MWLFLGLVWLGGASFWEGRYRSQGIGTLKGLLWAAAWPWALGIALGKWAEAHAPEWSNSAEGDGR